MLFEQDSWWRVVLCSQYFKIIISHRFLVCIWKGQSFILCNALLWWNVSKSPTLFMHLDSRAASSVVSIHITINCCTVLGMFYCCIKFQELHLTIFKVSYRKALFWYRIHTFYPSTSRFTSKVFKNYHSNRPNLKALMST